MGPRVLVLSGSTAFDHPASRIADAAQLLMARTGADITRISLLDHRLPLMDTVPEADTGIPAPVAALSRMIRHHDGLFVSSPIVSGMPAPAIVNMIAWLLVQAGGPERALWRDRAVALTGIAETAEQASSATGCLRKALESAGAPVVETLDMACGRADALDEEGWIRDRGEAVALENLCTGLCRHAADVRRHLSFT